MKPKALARSSTAKQAWASSPRAWPHPRPGGGPTASFLKLGLTYPLPVERIREFARRVERCVAIEEGDPYLAEPSAPRGSSRGQTRNYRFGELNVARVRRILAPTTRPRPHPPAASHRSLCKGCPHRAVFGILRDIDASWRAISAAIRWAAATLPGDGFAAVHGRAIGVGLGLRHVLPRQQARRVVSVIGDSTFMHSGLTGLAEMVYNPPATGHVLMILDNGTTAMTGMQEIPAPAAPLTITRPARSSSRTWRGPWASERACHRPAGGSPRAGGTGAVEPRKARAHRDHSAAQLPARRRQHQGLR